MTVPGSVAPMLLQEPAGSGIASVSHKDSQVPFGQGFAASWNYGVETLQVIAPSEAELTLPAYLVITPRSNSGCGGE